MKVIPIENLSTFSDSRKLIHTCLKLIHDGDSITGKKVQPLLSAVEDCVPFADIKLTTDTWTYTKNPIILGKYINKEPKETDFLFFIPTVNGLGNFHQCMNGLLDNKSNAKLTEGKIVVIDQTTNNDVLEKYKNVAFIYQIKEKHNFCRIMNLMQSEAKRLNLPFYLWAHDDAGFMDGAVKHLLDKVNSMNERWGTIFTFYDIFCAMNMEAVEETGPWDEQMFWYYSDNDWFRRVRLAGFPTFDIGGSLVNHYGSSTLKFATEEALDGRRGGTHVRAHYKHKWGNLPQNESFKIPYNGKP